ncbi:ABC transporter ATP-binding protein [Subtercola sp. Z020]|uniref:ABC transporter ATP-binding protein n=1 Tax=Subtercola sp. Z020 TaxID=2080582 RepID=UPI000CE8960F|nr:dipeptide/oligopeptide/nickel ABC transporter ATP-binding protein [Subtercola sp. Z020]PPF79320.1 ABC transporter ATP-binding protein [Subtercola sp. Z020]
MILTASHVSKTFGRGRTAGAKAVNDVTLAVAPGDFTAVVGESGSGKSTVARMLLGLIAPDEGEVAFDGVPLGSMSRAQKMAFRSSVQCVLQDPSAALNPRKSVRDILAEVIRLHGAATGRAAVEEKVREALAIVDLQPTEMYANRLPHQLSGGQRQRVLIARAVILNPSIIIADEAVSALDVSVKAGILNLLNRLRRERNIGYLFITHDLPVVKKVAGDVYVMRSGSVVEHAPKAQLFAAPGSEYTRELLAAAPQPDPVLARAWIRG